MWDEASGAWNSTRVTFQCIFNDRLPLLWICSEMGFRIFLMRFLHKDSLFSFTQKRSLCLNSKEGDEEAGWKRDVHTNKKYALALHMTPFHKISTYIHYTMWCVYEKKKKRKLKRLRREGQLGRERRFANVFSLRVEMRRRMAITGSRYWRIEWNVCNTLCVLKRDVWRKWLLYCGVVGNK